MQQPDSTIQLNDFLSNHIFTDLQTNDEWTYACCAEYTLDRETDSYRKKLNLIDLKQNSVRDIQLSFEADGFTFTDRNVLIKQSGKGETTLHLYSPEDDTVQKLAVIPFIIEQFAFFDNLLYFTAETLGNDYDDHVIATMHTPVCKEGRRTNGDGVRSLFRAASDGTAITLITALDMDVDLIDFDPLRSRIVFTAFSKTPVKQIESSIYCYAVDSKKLDVLMMQPFRISSVSSVARNTILFTAADLRAGSRNDNHQLYAYQLTTGSCRILGTNVDRSNESPGIVTDSYFSNAPIVFKTVGAIYMKRIERDREKLYRVSFEGEITPVETDLTVIGGFSVSDKGPSEEPDLLLIGLKGLQLSEVYRKQHGKISQLTHRNRLFANKKLSEPERMTHVIDGVEIDGYIYPPAAAELRTSSFPAVLMIHGGPKMLYAPVYSHDIQLLCSRGYFVICVNPMGSDGRGDEFANIRGMLTELPFRQLMKYIQAVIAAYPHIDKKRLGVTGGSYGGYMTNYIITHTDQFKAAVSERGIANLMTSFTATDIGYQFIYEYMGNTAAPWTDPDRIRENSPLYQADRAVTPTLFIHGKDDCRCSAVESVQMFNALNYHGTETRLCVFAGENHGLVVRGRPRSKQRRYKELLGWFTRYLAEDEHETRGKQGIL